MHAINSNEQNHAMIKAIDDEIAKFKKKLTDSSLKKEELSQIETTIQQRMENLKKTMEESKTEKEKSKCFDFSYSGRKLKILHGLTGATFFFTIGSLSSTAFGESNIIKYGSLIFGVLTAFSTGGITWYTNQITINTAEEEKKNKELQIEYENVALFKKFIKSFNQFKKNEVRNLKSSVKLMKSKSQFMLKQEITQLSQQTPNSSSASAKQEISEKPIIDYLNSPKSDDEVKIQIDEITPAACSRKTLRADKHLTTEEKIKKCLSKYEALPTKYKETDLQWHLVSILFQGLSKNDPDKKELEELVNYHSPFTDSNLTLQQPSPPKSESIEQKSSSESIQNLKDNSQNSGQENNYADRYTTLTKRLANRFNITQPIPYLETKNGYHLTAQGTTRNKRLMKEKRKSIVTDIKFNASAPGLSLRSTSESHETSSKNPEDFSINSTSKEKGNMDQFQVKEQISMV